MPPGFQLTVTSSVSQTDLTVISTATCTVANGAFGCTYADTGSAVPQGGLLVNPDSLLTVTETGFPDSIPDITFPVGLSSRFVTCQNISGALPAHRDERLAAAAHGAHHAAAADDADDAADVLTHDGPNHIADHRDAAADGLVGFGPDDAPGSRP